MFFILSAGRSGSKTIASTLDRFRNCVCRHHPQPELVVESTEYFYGEYPKEEIAHTLRETRPLTCKHTIYGEANLQLTLLIPVLCEVFPQCKFVWIIRDGRDQVASTFCRGWYDPEVDPERNPLWSQARLWGDRTGDFAEEEWKAMTPFQRCCWQWKKYNRIAEQELTRLSADRWCRVRLDQLKATLPGVGAFLGLRKINTGVEKLNVANQPVDYWQSWSQPQREQFEAICDREMDEWFPEWRSCDGNWQPIRYPDPDIPRLMLRVSRWLELQLRVTNRHMQQGLGFVRSLVRKAS
jgi:hypothetical protein